VQRFNNVLAGCSIIIDPENFDPAVSYSTAKGVYFKNFSWSSVAKSIKDDLIQEAVTRMYELSGKVREGANEKYRIGYGYFWVAHNAMLSYLKSWKRHMKGRLLGDIEDQEMAARIYHLRKNILDKSVSVDNGRDENVVREK